MPEKIAVSVAVEEYKFALRRLSVASQTWYSTRLDQFAAWCASRGLTLEKVKATETRKYIEYLKTIPNQRTGNPVSTHTIHAHARVIRAFLHWCNKEEGLDEYVTVKATRVDMPKLEKHVIEVFSPKDIKALLKACSKEAYPELQQRSRAVISLLYETGIRASELCGLTLENVHLDTRGASYIKVMGKGKKEREVGLGASASKEVYKYIHRFRKASVNEHHVFLSRSHQPLTVYGLDQLVERISTGAGVEDCYPHKFRHTFAVNYLQAGGDLFDLARLMGHSTTEVTKLYLEAYNSTHARQKGISLLDNLQ